MSENVRVLGDTKCDSDTSLHGSRQFVSLLIAWGDSVNKFRLFQLPKSFIMVQDWQNVLLKFIWR